MNIQPYLYNKSFFFFPKLENEIAQSILEHPEEIEKFIQELRTTSDSDKWGRILDIIHQTGKGEKIELIKQLLDGLPADHALFSILLEKHPYAFQSFVLCLQSLNHLVLIFSFITEKLNTWPIHLTRICFELKQFCALDELVIYYQTILTALDNRSAMQLLIAFNDADHQTFGLNVLWTSYSQQDLPFSEWIDVLLDSIHQNQSNAYFLIESLIQKLDNEENISTLFSLSIENQASILNLVQESTRTMILEYASENEDFAQLVAQWLCLPENKYFIRGKECMTEVMAQVSNHDIYYFLDDLCETEQYSLLPLALVSLPLERLSSIVHMEHEEHGENLKRLKFKTYYFNHFQRDDIFLAVLDEIIDNQDTYYHPICETMHISMPGYKEGITPVAIYHVIQNINEHTFVFGDQEFIHAIPLFLFELLINDREKKANLIKYAHFFTDEQLTVFVHYLDYSSIYMDISAIYEHFTRDQIQVVLQAFSRVQLKNYIKGKSEYLLQKRKNFDERLEMKAKGKDASELLKLRSILKAIEQDIDYKLIEDILKQASISEEINNFFRELIQQRNDFLQCKASLEAYMQTNMQDELSDSNESIYLKFWELMTTNHVRELGLNSAADIFDYGIKTTQDLDYLGISPSIDTSIKELTALLKAASSITDVTQLTHCYCGQLPLNEKEKTQLIKKCGDLKQTKEGIEEFLKELKSVLDACHPLKRLKKYLQSSQELTNVWSQLRQGQQLHSLSELITSGLIDKENVFNMCDILKHTGMKRRKMVFN